MYAGEVCVSKDWVYYTDMAAGGICAIRPDGTDKWWMQQLVCDHLSVNGDWFYWESSSDGAENLYRDQVGGFGFSQLAQNTGGLYAATDDWIFYTDANGLHKVRPDGTEPSVFIHDSILWLNVADGWIYYTHSNDTADAGIYKMRTDGSEKTKLSDENNHHYVNVSGDWIYYTNFQLYKMRTDGSETTKLDDSLCSQINIANNNIYFLPARTRMISKT